MGRMKLEKGKKRKTKKPKDANKPKRATSAYFFYMASCRDQAKKAGKNVSKVAEFTKECSEKWKNLSASQRKPFDEKAAKDKARYEKEMAEYKGKSSGDPDKPKRPPTSYFLFLADFRKNYVPKDDTEQNSAHKIILKEAGEKWRDMSVEDKKYYAKKSEEEGKKYKVAMAEYNKKSGGSVTGGSSAKKAKVVVEDDDDDEEEEEEDEEEEEEGEPEEEEDEEDEEDDD